jgi:threonine synthase
MLYYSLNGYPDKVDFQQATLKGQAPDKGLYFPENIPRWDQDFINNIQHLEQSEIAYHVLKPYVGECIPENVFKEIIRDTLSFEMPLKQITEEIYCLELFHGPTLAFKDLGARFLSRCMGYFSSLNKKDMVILVATSGDTGGAVADGFYNIEGTKVVILYPSGKVSPVQEKQLTALGGNIHAVEIQGDFDACQRLVKTAFADIELNRQVQLTSANSINIARWLPQQLFYVLAFSEWKENTAPVFSVPSGNFGNICAGMLAERSGLPVKQFIASCNKNDAFIRFMRTGMYSALKSIQTISNAMDVGDPSNFIRILELYQKDEHLLRSKTSSYSFTDQETMDAINNVYFKHKYLLDPHTAVAYLGMSAWQNANSRSKGIIIGTAHPVKFPQVVECVIKEEIKVPEKLDKLMKKQKNATLVADNYADIKNILSELSEEKAS